VLGAGGECRLSAALHRKLYPHQVVGVKWLQGLYQVSSGGILVGVGAAAGYSLYAVLLTHKSTATT